MKLNFYYREDCHLCDAMRKALVVFSRNRQQIHWQEVDIDRDIDLIRRFDADVPALYFGDDEICHHFFDEKALLIVLK